MIIKSLAKLEVGKIYTNGYLNDYNGNNIRIPIYILREATPEEFLSENPSGRIFVYDKFYEISVD